MYWICSQNNPKQGLYTKKTLHFSCFCLKYSNFVFTPHRRQSKTLLPMDERGSEIATTSVFECHLSPVGRLMDIENFVSNFFYLRSSIVLTFSIAAYPAWFRCTLHDVTVDISAHNWIKRQYNILFRISCCSPLTASRFGLQHIITLGLGKR